MKILFISLGCDKNILLILKKCWGCLTVRDIRSQMMKPRLM